MKHKRIWIISILFLIAVLFVFWIYPKVVLVKAAINFSKIDSIHVEGSLKLSNESYELDLTGTANYFHDTLYSKLSTNYIWNPLQAELYIDMKELKFYLTTNLSEEWIYSKQDKNGNGINHKISMKDVSFKKVNSDRKGENKYQIILSKEKFLTLLSSYLKNSDYSKDKVTIYIYTKESNISGIKIDDKITLSKKDNLYLSNIDLKFSSWNGISNITIPKEILENSKKVDKNVLETLFS